MAKKIILEVDVQGQELEQLNAELQQTEQAFREVQTEAKKTNEQIDEVSSNGGAIAILDQLTGGLATQFKNAWEAARLFNVSLKGMRTALVATGIGAMVVALGTIVAYWEDIKDFVTQTTAALKDQEEVLISMDSLYESQEKLLQAQIKAAGEGTEEAKRLKAQLEAIRKERIVNLELQIKNLEAQHLINEAKREEVGLWDQIVLNTFQSLGLYEMYAQKQLEITSEKVVEANAEKEKLAALKEQLILLQLMDIDAESPDPSGGGAREERRTARSVIPEESVVEFESERYLDQIQNLADAELAIIEQKNEAAYAIEQARIDATLQLTGQAMANIGRLVGEQTAAGKALGIAQAIIDTYVGANTAIRQGGLWGIPMAAAVITAGLANVKKIASTPLPGVAGGGGVSVGGGGAQPAIPQPNFNVVGDAGINAVADAVNNQTNAPGRAYIVYDDIKTAQELERNTVGSSTV